MRTNTPEGFDLEEKSVGAYKENPLRRKRIVPNLRIPKDGRWLRHPFAVCFLWFSASWVPLGATKKAPPATHKKFTLTLQRCILMFAMSQCPCLWCSKKNFHSIPYFRDKSHRCAWLKALRPHMRDALILHLQHRNSSYNSFPKHARIRYPYLRWNSYSK